MNITLEDFKKLEIRIGKIVSAEKIEGSDKLLKLEVEFGSMSVILPDGATQVTEAKRQIVSGIAQFYTPEQIIGKLCPFAFNLEPKTLKGVESQGMILCADDGGPVLLHPDREISPGSLVK